MSSATHATPSPQHKIEYLSRPAEVSMTEGYFQLASLDHFWVRRRFEVFQKLAGDYIAAAKHITEIGCGHGLLQRQIEDSYGKQVTGFDLNEYGLQHNVSRISPVCCYDIYQRAQQFQGKFDLILLFDVLEHVADEDGFLKAILYHLAATGRMVVSVPAGQWAYSGYDRAAGHVRRYSIETLKETTRRNGLHAERWSYWGLPLLPTLLARKFLMGKKQNDGEVYSTGFDSRSTTLNGMLSLVSKCELIPQRLVGTSVMATLQQESEGSRDGR
jgi:2-polyprenyl-3-methyl-5-hydroxy-6-metoxy-1,4-benzoquinol methylase